MKSIRSAFKASDKLENEGVFLEMGNTRIRLARAGGSNTGFNAAMAEAAEKHQRALKNGLLTPEGMKKIAFPVWAKHVVKSWETNLGTEENPEWKDGIDDGKGGVEPASFDNIVAFFHEVPDWFLECKTFSEDIQYYRESLVKDIAGN